MIVSEDELETPLMVIASPKTPEAPNKTATKKAHSAEADPNTSDTWPAQILHKPAPTTTLHKETTWAH